MYKLPAEDFPMNINDLDESMSREFIFKTDILPLRVVRLAESYIQYTVESEFIKDEEYIQQVSKILERKGEFLEDLISKLDEYNWVMNVLPAQMFFYISNDIIDPIDLELQSFVSKSYLFDTYEEFLSSLSKDKFYFIYKIYDNEINDCQPFSTKKKLMVRMYETDKKVVFPKSDEIILI